MKWYLDTHKFMSEVTRKALQIMSAHGITSESETDEIEAVERELANQGVYKSYDAAQGRVRRALFTYFKAYGCIDDNERLTEIGRLFVENKITVQEICFHYILNYKHKIDDVEYYPVQLLLSCIKKLNNRSVGQGYLTAYDFSKIADCHGLEEIDDHFVDELLSARQGAPIEVNERGVGYDVWSNILLSAGIMKRTDDRALVIKDHELANWILSAYEYQLQSIKGRVLAGPFTKLPVPTLSGNGGAVDPFVNEGKALQAFLFDNIENRIIEKYVFTHPNGTSFSEMLSALRLPDLYKSFYVHFVGLERLVGYCLASYENQSVKVIGSILAAVELTEAELTQLQLQGIRYKDQTAENILLYGVPGCGKSFTIRNEYCSDDNYMERAVFHPDYTYSDFVGQILPKVTEGHVSYEFEPGPFTRILKKACDSPEEEFFLIVEEINRGNAPAIFGDIFQLLDRDEDGVSEYGVSNENIALYVFGDKTVKIKIPGNLFVLGTMNTSDQNVFTLDTAFKRRWTMRFVENDVDACKYANKQICAWGVTWGAFAKTINRIIVELGENNLSNEDHRLGAYFVKETDLSDAERFGEKVLMYLWNDAFKYDHDKVFKTEYRTLDELIAAFMQTGFAVFNEELVSFETIEETEDEIVETDLPTIEQYLEGKNPILVEAHNRLFNAVQERIPAAYSGSVGSLSYAAWKSNDIRKASFADVRIQRNRIVIFTETPVEAELIALGTKLAVDNHHNHYFQLVYNDAHMDEIVKIVVESYSQLKVQ